MCPFLGKLFQNTCVHRGKKAHPKRWQRNSATEIWGPVWYNQPACIGKDGSFRMRLHFSLYVLVSIFNTKTGMLVWKLNSFCKKHQASAYNSKLLFPDLFEATVSVNVAMTSTPNFWTDVCVSQYAGREVSEAYKRKLECQPGLWSWTPYCFPLSVPTELGEGDEERGAWAPILLWIRQPGFSLLQFPPSHWGRKRILHHWILLGTKRGRDFSSKMPQLTWWEGLGNSEDVRGVLFYLSPDSTILTP